MSATVAGGLTSTAPGGTNFNFRVGIAGNINASTGTLQVQLGIATLSAQLSKDFYFSGTLAVTTGKARIIVPPGTWTIGQIRGVIITANTGASVLVDVNKNGTTIFTTQANRLAIPVSTTTVQTSATPDVTSVTGGDVLSVDIDQIGSTIAGADLSVMIPLTRAG